MCDRPIDEVRAALDRLLAVARRELGSTLHDPFMAMSFMALEVIPSLKLTDVGLVDVDKFELVPLFVSRKGMCKSPGAKVCFCAVLHYTEKEQMGFASHR